MNVVVCVKQIPDPASPGRLDPTTNTPLRVVYRGHGNTCFLRWDEAQKGLPIL